MRTPLRLPGATRNPVSILGMIIATAMAILFVGLLLAEIVGLLTNPYIGILIFVTVPTIFVIGLVLIPLGAWWTRRRMRGGAAPPEWPVIDLGRRQTRTTVAIVFVLTIVNIVIVSLAAYGGVHYMESAAFCGQTCHTTMEPQAVSHLAWPHAQVSCTSCHVGPGAGAFVQAKLAGAKQLMQVVTNNVPKPVPSPAELISPATETCQQCHSGYMHERDEMRVARDFADDEANTETATTLRMHIGGIGGGIHRHLSLDIDYPAADAGSETISFVRVRYPDGMTREYLAEGAAAPEGGAPLRRMDCLDCHNRPAHTFDFTPQRAVDRALGRGELPRELPFVRREAVAALSDDYGDREAALRSIAERLRTFYADRPGTDDRLVQRAIAGAQRVWARNIFPDMKVTWGTYPNHIGHVDSPGCFRCHDENHKAADGAVIAQDCELCHAIE